MDSIFETDECLVEKARAGDMDALDLLVRRHQSWVFNLALRMVWRREVAEDATQEILVKAATKLSTFGGNSTFRTWLYRIAVNHLLNVRKSEMEENKVTFIAMGESLDGIKDEDLPDERTLSIETRLLVDEAKFGCITAMLMCLDRRQRLAFILGEVFGETSEVGAAALEVSPANFRQLLSRARHDLYQFMNDKCGLVNRSNPCRCARKANGFMRNGWLDANNLHFSKDRISAVKDASAKRLKELQSMDEKHAEIYREQPFLAGPDVVKKLREILSQSSFDEN
jgi:RNA polymerase sigma factor (sigma-70 family)